jgi:isocitrate lyase
MFDLARAYGETGMTAYSALQEREFGLAATAGYSAVTHQKFVGTGYFDDVAQVISAGHSSTTALTGSTEEEQFSVSPKPKVHRA